MSEDLKKTAQAILRHPRKGALEQFASMKLVKSLYSDPLKKILLTIETAFLLEPKDVDREKLQSWYEVATSLKNVVKFTFKTNIGWKTYTDRVMYSVPWIFRRIRSNYDTYIRPWFGGTVYYYPDALKVHYTRFTRVICSQCDSVLFEIPAVNEGEVDERLKKRLVGEGSLTPQKFKCPTCGNVMRTGRYRDYETMIVKRVNADPFWSFFFEATQYLTEHGYRTMVGQFVNHIMPEIEKLQKTLAEHITPDVYTQTFRMMMGEEKNE